MADVKTQNMTDAEWAIVAELIADLSTQIDTLTRRVEAAERRASEFEAVAA